MASNRDSQPLTGQEEGSSSLKRLASLLRPYLPRLIVVLVMLFALTGVNMIQPMFIKLLFDDVFPNHNWSLLWIILAGILGSYTIRNVLYFISKYSAVRVGEDICFTLRNRLFERLQQMNLQFYQKNNPGQLTSRVMNDSFVVQSFIQDDLPTLLQALLLFLMLVATLYAVNWQLALASTIVLPLHLFAAKWFKGPIKRSSRESSDQLAMVQGNLIEKFLGVEVVKGFTGEERENQAFQQAIDISRQSQLRSKRYHVTQKVVADLLVGFGTISLLGFGAYQVLARGMEVGTFLAFFQWVRMLFPTVLDLMSGFAKLTKSTASIDRVFEMLDTQWSEESDGAPVIIPITGNIEFQGVSFRYGDGPLVLKNVHLEIPAGHVCAIVGPSGAGKSTLVSMVPRFIDATQGEVLLDGVDLKKLDLRELRRSVGIAFQECFLFNSSIFENLRYARADATMSQIVEVAKRTGAHDFISKLPDGYATILGENGVSLSRGEKQRITLTRAMLKNPKILVLDEATASIDTASESQIIPAILEFMKGKTTLMITHRAELLRHADMVVYISDGCVVYQGPPEEFEYDLLSERGTEDQPEAAPRRPDELQSSGMWRALRVVLLAATLGLTGAVAHAQETQPATAPATQPDTKPAPKPETHPETKPAPKPEAAPEAKPETKPAPKPETKPAPAPETKPAPTPAPKPAPKAEAKPKAPAPLPANAGKFIPQPGLNYVQIEDLLKVLTAQMQAQLGYEIPGEQLASQVPSPPPGVIPVATMVRPTDKGLKMMQLGYQTFRSQPPHIWVYSQTLTQTGLTANEDLAGIEKMVADAATALKQQAQNLTMADLEIGRITLSYIDADRCMASLTSLGYQVVAPGKPIDPKNLPAITLPPIPDPASTGLVGGATAHGGTFGLKITPSLATELKNYTSAATVMELLVFFNPAHPEQFSTVLDTIRTSLDQPAQQILIEAMVLEISETGLKRLGVEWELTSPFGGSKLDNIDELTVGRLPLFDLNNNEIPTLDARVEDVFGHFRTRIQALVRSGEAEVLSRPSILTLDNRQASIRVGEEIPVAKSATGVRGGDKITFDFEYIPIGILLNIRPRIAADGEEVSIQIDGVVSAEVPNEDLVILDNQGNVLARAPRISTRRVQTYSRIANNTPFIIGGLVSKDDTRTTDKVPLLGDIPGLGALFRSRRVDALKREVIIVITPYVLPEDQLVGRNMPKDEDAFDSFGNRLFRDAYRIRSEDVFDLGFLNTNEYLQTMRELANVVIRQNFRLAETYPFSQFVGDRIPGESILVYRQMYEVIKRLGIDKTVDPKNVIFFIDDEEDPSGLSVKFLWKHLTGLATLPPKVKPTPDSVFKALNGQAVAITYTMRSDSSVGDILRQPVPEVTLVDCPDETAWKQLLWAMNQPDELGRERYTILLSGENDLTRLQRAILLKHTVRINANHKALSLNNFSIGRLLLMPEVKEGRVHLIDAQVAKYFFLTEQYYAALRRELGEATTALREALLSPELRPYVADHHIPVETPEDVTADPLPDIQLSPSP